MPKITPSPARRRSERAQKPRRPYHREEILGNNQDIEFYFESVCGSDQPDPNGAKLKVPPHVKLGSEAYVLLKEKKAGWHYKPGPPEDYIIYFGQENLSKFVVVNELEEGLTKFSGYEALGKQYEEDGKDVSKIIQRARSSSQKAAAPPSGMATLGIEVRSGVNNIPSATPSAVATLTVAAETVEAGSRSPLSDIEIDDDAIPRDGDEGRNGGVVKVSKEKPLPNPPAARLKVEDTNGDGEHQTSDVHFEASYGRQEDEIAMRKWFDTHRLPQSAADALVKIGARCIEDVCMLVQEDPDLLEDLAPFDKRKLQKILQTKLE